MAGAASGRGPGDLPPPGGEPAGGRSGPRLSPLAWLPIPLLLAAIVAARAAGLTAVYPNDLLRLILSLVFYTLLSLGTLFLVGRSFLATGSSGLLLLECGVTIWSLAGTLGDAISSGDANANVTIFNLAILVAGLCHLAGAINSLRPSLPLRRRRLWLIAGVGAALLALAAISLASVAGWLPLFFVPGEGGTAVRYAVLVTATVLFLLSAGLLRAGQRQRRVPFTSWYVLALLLLAVGLLGVMVQQSIGGVVNWLSRAAQWLGGLYLFLAARAALRESDLPLLPAPMKAAPARYRYGVAVVLVLAAAALRLAFLPMIGTRAPVLTFYPAVILAALYGGFRGGVAATALSALLADYLWVEPAGRLKLGGTADALVLAVFLLSGVLISLVVRVMQRAEARAAVAEEGVQHAAELARAETQLRVTLESIGDGFFACDAAWRFVYVNAAAERILGIRREEVLGRSHWEVFPLTLGTALEAEYRRAAAGETRDFENFYAPWGRWFHNRCFPREGGGMSVYFEDVTERKRAEVALDRSRRTLLDLVEQAPFGIYIVDSGFRIALMNLGSQEAAFRNVRPVIGRDFGEAMRILWPEPVAAGIVAVFRHTLETGEPYFSSRFVNQRQDVARVEAYEWELHRMALPDGRDGVVCYYFDSTRLREAEAALQESEERLRVALESALLGAFDLDLGETGAAPDGLAGRMPGDGGDADDGPEGPPPTIVHPDDLELVKSALALALDPAGDGVYRVEHRVVRPDGHVGWNRAMGRVHFTEDGAERRAVRLTGVNQDVTERRRAEDALRRAMEELRRSNRDLEQFAYVASHDLQEPLRQILAFGDLLRERYGGRVDERGKQYLDLMADGARRLSALVSALLEYSRLSRPEAPAGPASAEEALDHALANLRAVVEETGASVTRDALPAVRVDAAQLAQLFQNLLSNALKFRRDGVRPEVHVDCRREGATCTFRVRDNGIGIPKDLHERTFVIFQRLHRPDVYPGTGIGLAICKKIVEQHGGRIWIESAAGAGSTFVFTLPAAPGA